MKIVCNRNWFCRIHNACLVFSFFHMKLQSCLAYTRLFKLSAAQPTIGSTFIIFDTLIVTNLVTQRLQAKSELKTRSPPPGISIHVYMSFRPLTLTTHTKHTRWLPPDHIVKKLIPECNAHNTEFHPAGNSTG